MIQFGKYDRKCKFVNLGATEDGAGGYIPERTTFLETFCRTVQMSGSSYLEQAQLGLPKTYKLAIQYRAGFNPDVNVILEYDGFDHMIKSVELNNERQRKEWIMTIVRTKPPQINALDGLPEPLEAELT
jgi:SPP1 family predicted phage head-tail adaptor